MTRAIRATLLATALLLSIALPAGAETTLILDGHFREGFGGAASSDPCDSAPPFCGSGTVAGLGKATTLAFVDGTKTITLVSDDSTLVMHETFVSSTTPGKSTDAPGALLSYGNPYRLLVTWVADPALSTGIFAGFSGTGTTTVRAAGDVLIVDTHGTLTLAE